MLPEGNARDRIETRSPEEQGPALRRAYPDNTKLAESEDAAIRRYRAPSKDVGKSIDVVFDLDDPEQAKALNWYRGAFGDDHVEVELLGDGKAVLRIYPGGARRLL